MDIGQIADPHGSGELSEKAQEACRKFIKSVGGSPAAQNDKMNHYGLAIILVPSSAANLNKFFMCVPKLQQEIPRLKPLFCKVFRENSIRMRMEFFSNELMRCIWTQYIFDESAQIKAYINKLRSAHPYQGQLETLLKDTMNLSQRLNFQVLLPEHLE